MDQPLKQWLTGKIRGEDENIKFKYLKNEKSFSDEIKNIFQFWKGYHLVKNKNLIKNSGRKLELLGCVFTLLLLSRAVIYLSFLSL